MRSENFERYRRALALAKANNTLAFPPEVNVTFNEDKPWECIFALSAHDGFPEAFQFWNLEVREKITPRL